MGGGGGGGGPTPLNPPLHPLVICIGKNFKKRTLNFLHHITQFSNTSRYGHIQWIGYVHVIVSFTVHEVSYWLPPFTKVPVVI